MIYTMNSTAFGDEAPTVPQQTGPPPTMIQVQAILLASLSAALPSAFLAMLGKQWLNRCAPVNIRGTIIERSRYRQRKLDGIANWYFDYVMKTLPLMLQGALLLLDCALSRYLWEYNTTVASVVVGFTSFGVLFYLFIVIAGTISVNCPYQTPAADFIPYISDVPGRIPYILYWTQDTIHSIQDIFLRIPHIPRHLPRVFSMFHSLFRTSIEESFFLHAFITIDDNLGEARCSLLGIVGGLLNIFFLNILYYPFGWFSMPAVLWPGCWSVLLIWLTGPDWSWRPSSKCLYMSWTCVASRGHSIYRWMNPSVGRPWSTLQQ